MTRLLLLLGLIALAAPASAQGYSDPYYGNPYGPDMQEPGAGVRVGIGVGASVYDGPQVFVSDPSIPTGLYRDVVQTKPAVTAEVSFPLGMEQLRARLLGGVLNIGADAIQYQDPTTGDIRTIDEQNPFLTSESILAEANLLYYFAAPGRASIAPYIFSGLGGIFATRSAAPGVSRSILTIPVGVGAEFALSRNLSLYGEASYRFGLTDVSDGVATLVNATTGFASFGPCDDPANTDCKPCDDPSTTNPACKPCDDPNTTNTDCKPCDDPDSTNPNCPTNPGGPVGPGNQDRSFGSSFNSALFTGGLRLGFAPAPRAYIPPPPPVIPPPPPVIPVAPPAVCNLIELNPVYFDYGSSTISTRARALLNENVELLLANPECCVFIDGTIDNQEMDRFGMPLAGRRAQTVYDYYLGRGVSASKLQIRNRGEGSPNCDKEDPGVGCERNRRVETIPVDCTRFQALLESPATNPY